MSKGTLIILLLTISSVFSFLLVQKKPNEKKYKIFSIDINKKQQKINYSVNKDFYLKFEANQSTGYTWYLTYNSSPRNLKAFDLEKDNSSKIYVKPTSQLAGATGNSYFRFRAQKKGKYMLKFVYKQYWDPKKDDLNVSLDVNIQ